MPSDMETSNPLVAVATFCERVLEEPDGVHTLVRVIDTVTVDAPASFSGKASIRLPLVIVLKSGDVRGKHIVTLRLRSPSNDVKALSEPITALFSGDEQGITIQIDFGMAVEEYGLYWVEVLVGPQLITRVPLRLRLRPESALEPSTSSSRASETRPRPDRP